MPGIFRRKCNSGDQSDDPNPERAAKRDAIDQMVQYTQDEAASLITEIRRRRERKLLSDALKDGTNGG